MTDKSKAEQYKNHPLTGLGLKPLLIQLVDHYKWDILAEQINVNCFKSNPSIASSVKFLRRSDWAREKVEAFYLYKFLQYPRPNEAQHKLPPRERELDAKPLHDSPAVIERGESEFFDDPITGPVFPTKREVTATRASAKRKTVPEADDAVERPGRRSARPSIEDPTKGSSGTESPSSRPKKSESSADPWAKWKS